MRRREVWTAVTVALSCAWAGAEAQTTAAPYRVGVLCAVTCDSSDVAAFRSELSSLGHEQVVYELRSADGSVDRLDGLARELAGSRVAVIFTTWGTAAGLAAKRATAVIPVVVGSAGDPAAAGLVDSLSRPGGNVTGFSSLALETEGKRLELISEVWAAGRTVGVFQDPTNPYSALALAQQRLAAEKIGVRIKEIEVRGAGDMDGAFAALAADRVGVLVLQGYLPIMAAKARLVELAARHRVATIFPTREFVDAGGLISYGADLHENARRAAGYVDRILKGAKPSDLPVQQPTTVELVINLTTARALGLTIPPALLARADEVIE